MQRINPWREVYDCPQSKDPWKNGIPDFALYLDVEPTNYCNFDCAFCVSKQAKRPRGYMDIELFKDICKQGKDNGTKGIRFLRWGEPLLHPDIIEMVKIAKSYNLLTHITTNGSYLTDVKCKGLTKSGLDSIIVSMQGLNKEEYIKFRGNHYDKTVEGIHNLLKNRIDTPYITISTTTTDETEEERNEYKEYWKGIVDDVSIGYTWFKRLQDKVPIKTYLERCKKLPHLFKCQEVMVKLSIDWDGTVSPCCLDYDQQLSVGNMKDDTLLYLWRSPQVEAIRTLLSQKRQDLFDLCKTCECNHGFRMGNDKMN